MARPLKDGLDYFSHDTDAVNDEKLECLMMLYGAKGYAFYFILLERIYRSSDLCIDISDAETIQILAKKISITIEEFNQILISSIKYGLFDKNQYENNHILCSNGVYKRAAIVLKKREAMRNNYSENISDAETAQKKCRNTEKTAQSKVKKSIEKKSTEKNTIVNHSTEKIYGDLISEFSPEFREAFFAFDEMRTKIKKPLTFHAAELCLKTLCELSKNEDEKIAVLNQSIINCWQGLFPLKQNSDIKSNKPDYSNPDRYRGSPSEINAF